MRWTHHADARERRDRSLWSRRREFRFEFLEERTLLSLQAVSLADSALFGASADGVSDSPSISADGQLVAFESTADNLVTNPTGGFNEQVYVGSAAGGAARLVSANASGAGGNGNSTDPVLSADGSEVVFRSDATDLVPEQVAAGTHLYETDLQSGTTTLVDVNTAGVGTVDNVDKQTYGADGTYVVENTPSVSADGRYVVFTAAATGLTSGPAVSSGTITNVYVRDMVAGTTTLVSADAAGSDGGNGNSAGATISADGSEVVFQSDASNLVATDTNNATDVFVRNLTTGVTSLVSANMSNTDSGDFESYGPVLSGDGTHVAFLSHADDLQSVHAHNLVVNVYERDLTTGVTTLISVNAAGTDSLVSNSSQLAVNDDGRYVAFVNGNPAQVYVRDTQAGTTALASANLAGMPDANGGNLNNPTLSADGQVVAFVYTANDLVSLPTNGQQSVFLRNLATGVTTLVSVNATGTAGGDNQSSSTNGQGGTADGPVVLSPDGTKVAFVSHAGDLVASDNNNLADVFVRDLAADTTTLVSSRAPTQPAAYTSHGPTYLGAISADGNSVAMNGGGPDLAATSGAGLIESVNNAAVSDLQTGALSAFGPSTGLTNSGAGAAALSADGSVLAFQDNTFSPVFGLVENIYTAAVPGGAPVLASVNADGTGPGNANSFGPVLSGDGGTVVFSSDATDLVPNFVEGNSGGVGLSGTGLDLFARNLETGVTTLVSINAAGTASGNGGSGSTVDDPALSGNPGSYGYSVSADGRYVAFASNATDLTAIDTSANGGGIYVRDLEAGTTQLVDVASDGTSAANGAPFGAPVISADGRYVVFISNATNLVAGLNLPAGSYAYVRDLQTETTRLVSVDSLGNPIEADGVPSISADGQVITFASLDVGGQLGAINEIYAYEASTGSAQLVSVNAAGAVADSPANSYHTNIEDDSVVSGDGRYVLFASTADNLAPGTFDGSENLYVRDLEANTTTLVSANRFGTGGGTALPEDRQQNLNPGVNSFAISADGSTIAFSSDQYDLVPGETYPTSSSDQYYHVLGGPSPTSNVFVSTQSVTPPTVGAIAGQVFDDLNGNGALDPGESGLSGWTVFLDLAGTGQFAAGDPTAVTDANGDYTFNNLTPGTYTVGEIVQAGYEQTAPPAPGTASVTVVAGQTATGPRFGDEPPSPALTVQSIIVPASAQSGQPASPLSYTVVNDGSGAATGDWQDAVYLSTETSLDATATLLAVLPQTGGLAPGASYTQSLSNLPLPILAAGNEYLLVQVDRRGQVPEPAASKAAEFAASTTPIAFAIPTVTVGTQATGSFTAAGQDQIYQVTVAAGQNLVLTLSSQASAGALSLLAQFGTLPAAGQAGTRSATDFTPNEQLVIAPTQAGTYFIDVHSQAGAAATAGFTLTATTPGLELLGSSPGAVGNGGNATIEIDGTGFTPTTAFTLVGPGGPIAAQATEFVDGTKVFATFNLVGRPVGSYSLQATVQGGTTVSAPAALTLQPAVAGTIVTGLSVPAQTRVGRVYSLVVTYKNTGNNDVPAPLLQIQSPNESPIGLAPNALGMENYTIQVMGLNPDGPAGILGPGQQGTVVVYFQSMLGDNEFTVAASTTADTTAVDYSILSMELNPGLLSDAQWNAIFANFQQEVGPTAGDYVAMLDQNAALLPPALGNDALATDVAELQIDRAQAAIGPSITGTLQTTDPQLAVGDLPVYATNETTGDVFATTSLNDGSFIFDTVTPGSYDFSVDGALISGTPTATVAAGQAVQGVTIPVSLGGAIAGQVLASESGTGVAGATVTAVGSDGTPYQVTTGPGGVYELGGLPDDTYTLLAEADGLAQVEVTGVTVNGTEAAQNFSLGVQSVISGTVTLAAGGPTGNDLVVVAQPPGNTDPNLVFGDVETGSGFSIANLPAGTYDLSISEDGYVPQTLTSVVAAGGTASIGTVQLSVSASASGTVTSTDPATPAADALVGAFTGTTLVEAVGTDATGAFSFTDLPAGTYTFGVAGATGTVTAPTVVLAPGQAATGIAVNVAPPPGSQGVPGDDPIQPFDTLGSVTFSDVVGFAKQELLDAQEGRSEALVELAELPGPMCASEEAEYDSVTIKYNLAANEYKLLAKDAFDLEAVALKESTISFSNPANQAAQIAALNTIEGDQLVLELNAARLLEAARTAAGNYRMHNMVDCSCMSSGSGSGPVSPF